MVRVRVTGFLVLTVTNQLCDQRKIAQPQWKTIVFSYVKMSSLDDMI